MFDNMTLWLNLSFNESTFSQKELAHCLNLNDVYVSGKGEIAYKGYLKNLRLKLTQYGLSINGSLAKYHLGNNLNSLTRQETEKATEKLSEQLRLPIKRAKVYRLEIGTNFLLKEPVNTYISCLGAGRYYEKIEYEHGLLYRNQKRAITFYNKLLDLKKHKENIPKELLGKNILRYELKLNKKLASQLKIKEVKAEMLYQEEFYITLLNKWKKEYFLLNRINKPKIFNEINIKKVKDLNDFLAIVGLQTIGKQEILNLLNRYKTQFSKIQLERLRARLKELSQHKQFTEPNEAIFELDRKVKQAIQYYR